jgi:LuxR family maltose regulon positive regulatory protein
LSKRESEVLQLIEAGLTNREIARRIVVEHGTVKRHVHNILGKLNARNRTEAVLKARYFAIDRRPAA